MESPVFNSDKPSEDTSSPTYRTLPHNLDAERDLLGAILINNEAAAKVSSFLKPEHFYEPFMLEFMMRHHC